MKGAKDSSEELGIERCELQKEKDPPFRKMQKDRFAE
jgi:hypothetical protein